MVGARGFESPWATVEHLPRKPPTSTPPDESERIYADSKTVDSGMLSVLIYDLSFATFASTENLLCRLSDTRPVAKS